MFKLRGFMEPPSCAAVPVRGRQYPATETRFLASWSLRSDPSSAASSLPILLGSGSESGSGKETAGGMCMAQGCWTEQHGVLCCEVPSLPRNALV